MSFLQEPINTKAKVLLTDSRVVSQPTESIFFAISGERHNGHQYIEELYKKGVREFVIESKYQSQIEALNLSDATFWVSNSPVRALQKLVAVHREQFTIPVIGITGSNGKTIVKEWLSQLLGNYYNIVKSPRSYNSQIGVPLSVWQMTPNHELGIFEAGISKTGEMENIEPVIQPTMGIFTNIGTAHNEGFRSLKQKVTEKIRLFRRAKTLIYCKDYEEIDEEIRILLKAVNPNIELIAWSRQQKGSIWLDVQKENIQSKVAIFYDGDEFDFTIPFTDDASIENAIHCIFAMLSLLPKNEASIQQIQSGLNLLKPVGMRLEIKQGINDCYLIDDTYNNDLAGLNVALDFLTQQHTQRTKTLIISDVLQSGLKDIDLYTQIAHLAKSKGIGQLIGIGEKITAHQNLFKIEQQAFFHSTDAFLSTYNFGDFKSQLILVKGARTFAFEKIINRLIQKVHGTVFEVNLDALTHNLNFYRSKAGANTKIMAMVKAFAYGSGSAEVASLLQYHRVDYLAVAYPDEGVFLRQNGIKLPIMVLNPQPETYSKIIDFDLEPEIYSLKMLHSFLAFIEGINHTIKVHLKLDTGMHRLGFIEADIEELLSVLKQNKSIEVASIFSHLVGADESEHNDFSKIQIKRFEEMSEKIIKQLGYKPLRHICNSAGILRFPDAHFDMVRLGIGLYGVEVSNIEPHALQTVGTLKTTISQIKNLKAGETVGYSRKGILDHDARIATIAIGYADGFDRGFSKGIGKVWVNGTLCPIVGNICMDMTMVDVTDAICDEGDEVIIFGKELSINELAKNIQTIPYELLTGVSERVKRIFYKE